MTDGVLVSEDVPCVECGARGVELCGDKYCRACHVSITFEACVDGSWVAANLAALRSRGMPPSRG